MANNARSFTAVTVARVFKITPSQTFLVSFARYFVESEVGRHRPELGLEGDGTGGPESELPASHVATLEGPVVVADGAEDVGPGVHGVQVTLVPHVGVMRLFSSGKDAPDK
jgi:hypothetical protein